MSQSPMPHPDDVSAVVRWPHKRHSGIYIFVREPFDTEMHWTEPSTVPGVEGDTYLLTWEDSKRIMRNVLEAPEMFVEELCDCLWNFYHLAVDFDAERFIALRQERDGWEEEIDLGFHDARITEGVPDNAAH